MGDQRLLVVGVGSELGSLAAALLEPRTEFSDILGIDAHPPRRRLRRTSFARIEPESSAEFVRRVVDFRPDVVVHLGVWEPHARLGTKEAQRATGKYALALCDALSKIPSVSRIVVRSGVEVYGARPHQPVDERTAVRPTSTYGHMLSALESMIHDAAPAGATTTVLRFAPVIGSHVPSPLGRLLRLPVVPIDLLSRAQFQVVADDDAALAVVHAATSGRDEAVNVAASGPIAVNSIMRHGRRLPVPVLPYAWPIASSLSTLAGAPLPDHVRELLRHGRCARTTTRDVEYRPTHSTSDVIARLYSWPSVVRIAANQPRDRVA